MGDIMVSVFSESMAIKGIEKDILIRYAQQHHLDWYVKGKLFYLVGEAKDLYRVLIDLTATATLIVD